MKRKDGFTLVELLVVIAIIIILAAILFPVFARAREKAQQTKCVNNLKQMGSAISMYEDDYDNPMPWFITPNEVMGYSWKDLMDPYIKQLKKNVVAGYEETEGEVYKCPSAPIEEQISAVQVGRSYGYNEYFRRTVTSAQLKYPALTLRITETSGKDPDGPPDAPDPGGSWSMPVPDSPGFVRYPPGWHNGMNNCLWVDGHVSNMPRKRVMLTDGVSDTDIPGSTRVGNVWARFSSKPAYTPDG